MLSPKKTKYRKRQKGRMRCLSKGGVSVAFGDFGIQALEPGWISARQIEAARVAINRAVKREGRLYVRIFPDKPISKKPAEVRMGKGKGNPDEWVAIVKPGRVMYELDGVSEKEARVAFRLAHHKLPIDTRIVIREDG